MSCPALPVAVNAPKKNLITHHQNILSRQWRSEGKVFFCTPLSRINLCSINGPTERQDGM